MANYYHSIKEPAKNSGSSRQNILSVLRLRLQMDGYIYIGDTKGELYAVDSKTGSQKWVFNTLGSSLNNDTIGFDRKAIISSAVIEGDAVIFGCRDGFLYCVNRFNGELKWKFDHHVSWVISSPAVANGNVITGTSDGHFVQSETVAKSTSSIFERIK